MADPSFDVVSKVDRQEVDNALNQAAKELAHRFDFRGTGTSIAWAGEEALTIQSETEERAKAAVDVFRDKLVKRQISLKAFEAGEPALSGKTYRISGKILQGIEAAKAKEITKSSATKAQGRPGPDPGRPAAREGQEEGRPAGRDRAVQGQGLRIALQLMNYR